MKKYIISLLLPLLFSSCEDFLSVESPSNFDNSYVYSNEGEMFRALTAIYSPLTDVYGGRWVTLFIPNTDVEFNVPGDTPSSKGDDFDCFQPQSLQTDLTGVMTSFYKAINLANNVIVGIEESDLFKNADKTAPSNLMQMYGEAKTLRAMVYLDLVRCWGDVPLMLKPSSSDDDMYVEPTDRDSILTYMINDLISVEPTMMYAKDINYGVERANREFCQGLIALMSLTRGGYSLRPNKEDPSDIGKMVRSEDWRDYYAIAEEYAYKVIDTGFHELNMGFEDFWKMVCNWGTVTNDDFIFDIPLLKSSGTGEMCYYVGVPLDYGESNPYGKASGSYNLTTMYMLSFDEDDLRRDVTCVNYSYDANLNQKGVTIGDNNLGRIKNGKYRRNWMETPLGASTTKSTGVNVSYMRYADILTMYAEAANEMNNGPTPEARAALKQVRKRAFPQEKWAEKVDAYVDGLSGRDEFFEAVANERKWEFGGENKRHYDLARWNTYGQVLVDFYRDAVEMGFNANFPETKYLQWSKIPDNYYYRQVDNLEQPGTKKIEFLGLHKRVPNPADSGDKTWTRKGFANGFIVQKTDANGNKLDGSDPANWEPCPTLKKCFRGYFTDQTIDMIDPKTDPVPYLMPFGHTFISANPKIKNYYGFK